MSDPDPVSLPLRSWDFRLLVALQNGIGIRSAERTLSVFASLAHCEDWPRYRSSHCSIFSWASAKLEREGLHADETTNPDLTRFHGHVELLQWTSDDVPPEFGGPAVQTAMMLRQAFRRSYEVFWMLNVDTPTRCMHSTQLFFEVDV